MNTPPWPAGPSTFSDHLVFVDESGDHGLDRCDPNYPVFVLAFCVVEKRRYADEICPALAHFKFRHFGHDLVILHEHEIAKSKGAFTFLLNAARREVFHAELTALIAQAPITLVAVVIHKTRLKDRYREPTNPYHLALEFGLERVSRLIAERGGQQGLTPVICEARGRREDDALELEFRRVAASIPGLEIHFVDKRANLPGLQLADLVARPIGRHVLAPQQPNRAFDVIQPKLRRGPRGQVEGFGLKVFP